MSRSVLSDPLPSHVASEFLLWLCHRHAVGANQFEVKGNDCWVEVNGSVDLKRPEDLQPTVSLRGIGDAVSAHPELLASLRAGRHLHRATLQLTVDDRVFRLTLTGSALAWSGVKLPCLVRSGEEEEMVLEQMFLYEELHASLQAVFLEFAQERVDSVGWPLCVHLIRSWLGDSFTQVFRSDTGS
jgi:hypothetical protein